MYRFIYRITGKQEKSLARALKGAGIREFFVETSAKGNFLNVFSHSLEQPAVMDGFSLETVSEVSETSWGHQWAASYSGHELTPSIYVRASGSPLPVKQYRHVIEIDPRDSFGDGHHPTTRLCAQLLERHIASHASPGLLSMMDIGTGSGILVAVASVLGLRDIDCFDIDEQSVFMAERNLAINGITWVKPLVADIYTSEFARKYDVITANLLTALIEDNIDRMMAALAERGVLIISGVSNMWTGEVKRILKGKNIGITEHKKLEGWNGFMLTKRR